MHCAFIDLLCCCLLTQANYLITAYECGLILKMNIMNIMEKAREIVFNVAHHEIQIRLSRSIRMKETEHVLSVRASWRFNFSYINFVYRTIWYFWFLSTRFRVNKWTEYTLFFQLHIKDPSLFFPSSLLFSLPLS